MSGGLYSHTTRANGTTLTASIYNADHVNHITNSNPSMVGGYSDSTSEMQAQTDPGEVGTESLSSSLADEIERMRFILAEMKSTTYWYESAVVLSAAQNLSDVASAATAFANIKQNATTSATGVVEIATDAEAVAASATDVVVTPANLAAAVLLQDNNLSDLDDAVAARTNLGGILTDAIFPGAIVGIVEDQKTSGTAPQTLTAGADRTRQLTQITYNRNTTVSLSSNQFTLPAGTWFIKWSTPVGDTSGGNFNHQSLLHNITDAADVTRGNPGQVDGGDFANTFNYNSTGSAVVTIASAKAFEIRHRVSGTIPGGQAASLGTEVYTRVEIFAA